MRHLGPGLLLALLLSACTADNPLYTPSTTDLAPSQTDGPMTPMDLALSKLDGPLPPQACMDGQRACAQAGSEGCYGGMFVVDRVCPTGSSCGDGHCAAPAPSTGTVGKSCSSFGKPTEAVCLTNVSTGSPSCQPFVTNPTATGADAISWVCAPPIGMGLPGTPCTSGKTCRSGFCGTNGTCFRACASSADCPSQGGWQCVMVGISVEGHNVIANSCVPN